MSPRPVNPADAAEVLDPQMAKAIADQQQRHQESEDRNIAPSIRTRLLKIEERLEALEKEIL